MEGLKERKKKGSERKSKIKEGRQWKKKKKR